MLDQQTSSGINFHYYRTGEDVRVSSIYPMGGPRAGGTTVTVRGTGFRDLDHGIGLYCSFGTDGPLVPATVAPGSAEDPTSFGQLTCLSPPITPTSAESQASCVARMTVPVLLTLNGNNSHVGARNSNNNEPGSGDAASGDASSSGETNEALVSAMTGDEEAPGIQFTYHELG